MRQFAARGFDGTSLQEVADEVGVRKPSVLHYFPSKEALREAVTGQILEHWRRVLPNAALAARTGSARFEALGRELTTFFADDPDRARLLLREALDRPEEYRRRFLKDLQRELAIFSDGAADSPRPELGRPAVDSKMALMYLVHFAQLAVVSVAHGGIRSAPVRGGARDGLQRVICELASNMAQSSLQTAGAASIAAAAGPERRVGT